MSICKTDSSLSCQPTTNIANRYRVSRPSCHRRRLSRTKRAHVAQLFWNGRFLRTVLEGHCKQINNMAVWRSHIALVSIRELTVRRARPVRRWVTVSASYQLPRATQPGDLFVKAKSKGLKVRTLDIAPLRESSPQKRSGMARVLKGSHSFTCTLTRSSAIEMSHTCLCLPSRSWYSFTDPWGWKAE